MQHSMGLKFTYFLCQRKTRPGNGSEVAADGWIGEAEGAATGGIAENALANKMCSDSADDTQERERICEQSLDRDLETCEGLGRSDGASAYKICEAQGMLRYSACLRGRDTTESRTYQCGQVRTAQSRPDGGAN